MAAPLPVMSPEQERTNLLAEESPLASAYWEAGARVAAVRTLIEAQARARVIAPLITALIEDRVIDAETLDAWRRMPVTTPSTREHLAALRGQFSGSSGDVVGSIAIPLLIEVPPSSQLPPVDLVIPCKLTCVSTDSSVGSIVGAANDPWRASFARIGRVITEHLLHEFNSELKVRNAHASWFEAFRVEVRSYAGAGVETYSGDRSFELGAAFAIVSAAFDAPISIHAAATGRVADDGRVIALSDVRGGSDGSEPIVRKCRSILKEFPALRVLYTGPADAQAARSYFEGVGAAVEVVEIRDVEAIGVALHAEQARFRGKRTPPILTRILGVVRAALRLGLPTAEQHAQMMVRDQGRARDLMLALQTDLALFFSTGALAAAEITADVTWMAPTTAAALEVATPLVAPVFYMMLSAVSFLITRSALARRVLQSRLRDGPFVTSTGRFLASLGTPHGCLSASVLLLLVARLAAATGPGGFSWLVPVIHITWVLALVFAVIVREMHRLGSIELGEPRPSGPHGAVSGPSVKGGDTNHAPALGMSSTHGAQDLVGAAARLLRRTLEPHRRRRPGVAAPRSWDHLLPPRLAGQSDRAVLRVVVPWYLTHVLFPRYTTSMFWLFYSLFFVGSCFHAIGLRHRSRLLFPRWMRRLGLFVVLVALLFHWCLFSVSIPFSSIFGFRKTHEVFLWLTVLGYLFILAHASGTLLSVYLEKYSPWLDRSPVASRDRPDDGDVTRGA